MLDGVPPQQMQPNDTLVVDLSKGQIQTFDQQSLPPEYADATAVQMPATTETPPPPMENQVPPSTKPTPPSTATSIRPSAANTPAKGIPEKTFSDPLRDLILLSEAILVDDETEFVGKVKYLAEDSSCLEHVLEVNSKDSYHQIQTIMKENQKLKAMAQPFDQGINLFQNPKEMIDPVKEAEFLKTLEALEDTDDSEAGEKPVLGKVSLVRRAKSAATRTASDKRKQEEAPVMHMAWEEIEVR